MLCGDTNKIIRKNSEKGRKFRLPGRNRAEDETPRILFKDAAALYIEFSKAATAAETAIKRMRFFVQFFLPAFGDRDIVSLIGDSFEQVTDTYGHMYESDKINAVRLLDRD